MPSVLDLWKEISSNSVKVERLFPEQQANLLHSLQELDKDLLKRMRASANRVKQPNSLELFRDALEPTEDLKDIGEKELRAGRVGVVIQAGGQGSRLGKGMPKGMYTFNFPQKTTLFQIICEKIAKGQKKYGVSVPLAIMTSIQTDRQIRDFFSEHQYWGLNPENVHFFTQGELPLLDLAGDPWISADGTIRTAPNGNGGVFAALKKSGVLENFENRGTEYLIFLPIDNVLAEPFNYYLIGAVCKEKKQERHEMNHVCLKGVKRLSYLEKTGVFVLKDKKLNISEYIEHEKNRENQLTLPLNRNRGIGNTGEMCINIKFARYLSEKKFKEWPIYIVKKSVIAQSETLKNKTFVLKGEHFNFDLLNWAEKSQVVMQKRKKTFLSIKDQRDILRLNKIAFYKK